MIGKTLGHYQITSQLGKGGMGEVYQAKDQVLGRDVAIKVLPEEFARDSDRVARFQREAKVLASLNHPNIAAIHGLEQSEGTNFLVLELVEGETLADRIKQGPIPVEESLKLAIQIAEALEAAHEKGVIHRDLKPANIKVTPEGKVKVLDFGLAKAYAGDRDEVNLSNSPTLSDAATQQGIILGTAAYMSPEQARGESVDRKADIWAFGVVLFEMLTGRTTFEGRTVSDTLASVLAREPGWQSLPSNLHPRIRLLLERCLEKDAKDRYGVVSDARVDIQKALADPSGVLVQAVAAAAPRGLLRAMLPWVAALVGMILVGVGIWLLRMPEPRRIIRFDYELPEGQQFSSTRNNLAISPDGRQFVYSTQNGLYLRSMDEVNARLIAGTDGRASQPFFSPDGKSIGFLSANDRQLKKIAVGGGTPVTLCTVANLVGAWWGTDNAIIYGQYPVSPIMRVSANGGTPEVLIKPKDEVLAFPQILPDGKSVLYTASSLNFKQARVMVQSLRSGEAKELFAGFSATYLPTQHIVYYMPNSNNAFAVPFDLNRLEVVGAAVPVVEGARQTVVSEAGTLAYIPEITPDAAPSGGTLVWVDRRGKEEPLHTPPDAYGTFRISPDGKKVALARPTDGTAQIWIWDLIRETMTRLTFDPILARFPLWLSDGKRIAFHSDRNVGVYVKAADGTGKDEPLGSVQGRETFPWSWSGDGKTLVVVVSATRNLGPDADIGTLSMEGDRKLRLLLKERYSEAQPRISPNGGWMAYTSNESGKYEVYVRPFPEVDGGRWQVSTNGGNSPLWSPDGRDLFYRNGDSVMAVPVEIEPAFKAGKPEALFRGTYAALSGDGEEWDISPEGKRFLMMKPRASTTAAPAAVGPRPKISIVLNWFEELKQRVPTK